MMRSVMLKIKDFLSKYPTLRRYIIYCVIGFTGLALDMLIFNLMITYLNISPYISNIVSMFVSINNNFFLNTYFNFKKSDKLLKRWAFFCIIGVVGIFVSDILLNLFYEGLGLDVNISKLITIPIIATLQFILHKLITYKDE